MKYLVKRIRTEHISAEVEAFDEEEAIEKFEDMECDPESELDYDDDSEIVVEVCRHTG